MYVGCQDLVIHHAAKVGEVRGAIQVVVQPVEGRGDHQDRALRLPLEDKLAGDLHLFLVMAQDHGRRKGAGLFLRQRW